MTDIIAGRNLADFDFCGRVFGSALGAFQYQCLFCTNNYIVAADFELHVVSHLVKEFAIDVSGMDMDTEPPDSLREELVHIELEIKPEPIDINDEGAKFNASGDNIDDSKVSNR